MPGLLRIREERGSPGREGVVMEILLLPLLWTVHFPPSCGQNVHLSRRGEEEETLRANCAHSSLRMLPSPPRFDDSTKKHLLFPVHTIQHGKEQQVKAQSSNKKGQGRDRVTRRALICLPRDSFLGAVKATNPRSPLLS